MSNLPMIVTPPTKKEAVILILDEMKKLIAQAIDEGKDGDLSPLDLITTLVQQIVFEAMAMETEFEKEDNDKGGKAH